MRYRLLRLLLIVAAFGWGISILGVILPWSLAIAGLNGLGAGPIPEDPMLNYWMRMAGGGFFLIGVIFGVIAVNPRKYAIMIPIMGYLSIVEGSILLVSGVRLGLPPFPFWGDTSFCLLTGIGIVLLHKEAI